MGDLTPDTLGEIAVHFQPSTAELPGIGPAVHEMPNNEVRGYYEPPMYETPNYYEISELP